ncbi:MAG: GGDEF domain-containing protein [Alteromonadales bacterium]|nr:GGDEF domain-containing protein [Alteromonadales bacterium]
MIETHRLNLGWLMSIGLIMYGGSLIADVLDEFHIPDDLAVNIDIVDDTLKLGIIFVGFVFYKAIRGKRRLINKLQLEVKSRKELESKLHKLTRVDELTQIGNRRAFFQKYPDFVNQHQYPQLIFIDLDNFKQLNDTQGHQQGDQLLIDFADCLTKQSADDGQAYRFGGDEFVILYDSQDALSLITTINESMHKTFSQTKVSLSYGAIPIDNSQSADDYILLVDQLMYNNKQQRKSIRRSAHR